MARAREKARGGEEKSSSERVLQAEETAPDPNRFFFSPPPLPIDYPWYLILPYPIVVTSDKIMRGEDALAHLLHGEE